MASLVGGDTGGRPGIPQLCFICVRAKIKWRDVEVWVKGEKAELKTSRCVKLTRQISLKLTGLVNL